MPLLLEALETSHELLHNDIEELPVVPWVDGRVVLIGDAAHAMTPNMGQGAAMALEDSAVLVELLEKGVPLAEALHAFCARREPRVRWVKNQSRRIGRIGHLESGVACAIRNIAIRLAPSGAGTKGLLKIASQPI